MFKYCHSKCKSIFRSACYTEANSRYEKLITEADEFWGYVLKQIPKDSNQLTITLKENFVENQGYVHCYLLSFSVNEKELCTRMVKIDNECCKTYQVMTFQKRTLELLKANGYKICEETLPLNNDFKKIFVITK